jgi:hypothetical protein
MNHSDFHIRLELLGPAGFCWRCSDIQPDHDDDPNRCQGFPFIATEFVFDEHKREQCHLTEEEAIRVVIHEADTSGHPGYPNNDVNHMMRARLEARVHLIRTRASCASTGAPRTAESGIHTQAARMEYADPAALSAGQANGQRNARA